MRYESPEVIAVVLAAGYSRRFGADKRRATLTDGRPLLRATLELARQGFAETWVVLRESEDAAGLDIPDVARVLRAPAAPGGLGDSLAAAFHRLGEETDAMAAAVMLGDMPWVLSTTCQDLAARAHPECIVRPRHAGRIGHPVVFGRAFWPRLGRLSGERGARDIVSEHPGACRFVDVDDPGIHRDVDVPSDVAGYPVP